MVNHPDRGKRPAVDLISQKDGLRLVEESEAREWQVRGMTALLLALPRETLLPDGTKISVIRANEDCADPDCPSILAMEDDAAPTFYIVMEREHDFEIAFDVQQTGVMRVRRSLRVDDCLPPATDPMGS
jgi:hypothetical protein